MKKWKYVVLIAVVLFGLFAATRITEFTTYFPLSGRIFSVDVGEAEAILIRNGTTGEDYSFESEEEQAVIIEKLEALKYRYWLPKLPIATGGWSWCVSFRTEDAFDSYMFGDDHITVNGLVYFVPAEQLDELRAYVEP